MHTMQFGLTEDAINMLLRHFDPNNANRIDYN